MAVQCIILSYWVSLVLLVFAEKKTQVCGFLKMSCKLLTERRTNFADYKVNMTGESEKGRAPRQISIACRGKTFPKEVRAMNVIA